ncbi:hypothetical protein INT47_000054 [Mucor saturninus]|uniref:Tc1-like transposase DDE domain-containing protein n=1 Tax=Mucor saturninus TaxID=64648 RepID=A0A8H7RI92_9FUNG|nr:hypothetical protein INT47_000054 [Mucor saturninus]
MNSDLKLFEVSAPLPTLPPNATKEITTDLIKNYALENNFELTKVRSSETRIHFQCKRGGVYRNTQNHMKKKCRLTYKRIFPRYYGRNTDKTVTKRRDAAAYWVSQNIGFMNECVFLGEAGFNRSMHRSYGWSEAGTPCKIDVQTKGANVSILGAICKSGLITLSRKEVVLGTRSGKRTRTGDKSQAPKRKGTTNIDLLEYIEQILTTLDAANMSYKYLVLDNASIHKAALIEDWVGQRGYEDCCK